MSSKVIVTVVLVVALLVIAVYFFTANEASAPVEQNVGIANPASTNCVKLGGTLEIAEGEGGQYGLCHLPDGRVCEEWALFRDNECTVP
jgi:putative hemolysin